LIVKVETKEAIGKLESLVYDGKNLNKYLENDEFGPKEVD